MKIIPEAVITRCAQMLACYRKNCASSSSVGQPILSEGMKLLPVYLNSVFKSDVLELRSLLMAMPKSDSWLPPRTWLRPMSSPILSSYHWQSLPLRRPLNQ